MESLAVISDVHGNRWALAAVLHDIQQRGVTQIVNLGDCVYGPLAPAATARMLIERNIPTVCGNEDRLLTGAAGAPDDNPTMRMNRESLTPDHLQWLAALPPTLTIDSELFLFHGTPHDDTEYLLRQVGETAVCLHEPEQVSARLSGISARVFLCGHDHLQATKHLADKTIVVNPGSVGLSAYTDDLPYPHAMAAGSPQARFSLLFRTAAGWDVEHHQVDYEWETAARCAEKNDRPDWAHWLRTGTATVGERY